MPITPTYPGVYIEEIPSGVRTITGVATSIAAFAGWAPKGTTTEAELVQSWADYERKFGGLNYHSVMSYAVLQFFNNGGQQAYIVRLAATDSVSAEFVIDGLTLTANGPGAWANDYKIRTKRRTETGFENRFLVEVVFDKDGANTTVESFENLSMAPDDLRSVESVINSGSSIITAKVVSVGSPPEDEVSSPPGDTTIAIPPTRQGVDGAILRPNDSTFVTALNASGSGGADVGVYLLDKVDLFNLLCVPGHTEPTELELLQKFCRDRRAFLIADCDKNADFESLEDGPTGLTGKDSINSAFYFPWIKAPDPLQGNRLREFPPCGFAAGLYAQTDTNRGVWKAPAGTEASLTGAFGVTEKLTDLQNGTLNIKAVNCIRTFPVYGTIIWGARTLQGNNEVGSEWKYVPVRRTALFIEETLFRALKWVVFEPNDEPLWAQIRLNVGAFMQDLFRQGAFQGKTPREAYFVKCDKETTTQSDINRGIVNIVVGFAPLKPAEFVIIKLQQIAGQIEV
jgi:phage tail sheath protein FI